VFVREYSITVQDESGRCLNAAAQTPIDNIMANYAILRNLSVAPESTLYEAAADGAPARKELWILK